MQKRGGNGRNYFTAIGVMIIILAGCTKQVEADDEVRISIFNGVFAKIRIEDSQGRFVASGMIDHSEQDG